MYKFIADRFTGLNRTDAVLRTTDNALVPNDIFNKDWVEYQTWLGLGNTTDPA